MYAGNGVIAQICRTWIERQPEWPIAFAENTVAWGAIIAKKRLPGSHRLGIRRHRVGLGIGDMHRVKQGENPKDHEQKRRDESAKAQSGLPAVEKHQNAKK